MKFLSWLVLIAICLLVVAGLGYFKYSEIQAGIEIGKSFPEPVETVEVVVARQSIYQPTTRVTGEVIAPQTADLTNELAGRIVSVGFAPGAKVSEGQLLLALDTSEESARLRAAEADQDIARLGFDRAERLLKRGAGSQEDRDRARAQFDAARANTGTLQAIIDKKRIRAPFDATASLHQLEVGQYLAANSRVARLVGIGSQTWIDFALPQQQANRVAKDTVAVYQGNQLIGEAELIARDASINPASRNLSFRTLLAQSETNALYPGTLVTVEVAVGQEESVVAIPATSIRRNALGSVVYVIGRGTAGGNTETETLRAQRRSVTVGSSIDFDATTQQQLVVIESGLAAGERIAANGAFKLRDGIRVNLLEQAPPGGTVQRVSDKGS